jgi:hypothetical protein
MEMSGHNHALVNFPLRGKPPVTVGRRLDGAHSHSGRCGEENKLFPLLPFTLDFWVVQTVAHLLYLLSYPYYQRSPIQHFTNGITYLKA